MDEDVVLLYIAAFTMGYVANVAGAPLVAAVVAATALPLAPLAASYLTRSARRLSSAGYGVSINPRYLYLATAAIAAAVFLMFGVAPLLAAVGNLGAAAAAYVVSVGALLVSLTGGRIKLTIESGNLKTNSEVEMPFVLAEVKLLSSTHYTLHDIVTHLSQSVAYPTWSRIFRNVQKVAAVTGSSIISAMRTVAERHPSPTVRTFLDRMATAAATAGSVREVADKVFNSVYTNLETRLEASTERLKVLNAMVLFAFFFTPVMIISLAPMTGVNMSTVFLIVFLDLVVGVLMYIMITAAYPSGFAARLPMRLVSVAASSAIAALASLIVSATRHVPDYVMYATASLALAPAAVISEAVRRQVDTYSAVMRLASDAADAAAMTGEEYMSVLKRYAARAPKPVRRVVDKIVYSYKSPELSAAVVKSAPTLLHASFIDALLTATRAGADAAVIAEIAKKYETLLDLRERFKQNGRNLAATIYMTVAMVSGMIVMLGNMIGKLARMIKQSGAYSPMTATLASFNPAVLHTLSVVSLLFSVLLGFFAGKSREGTLVAGGRDALIIVIIHAVVTRLALLAHL